MTEQPSAAATEALTLFISDTWFSACCMFQLVLCTVKWA